MSKFDCRTYYRKAWHSVKRRSVVNKYIFDSIIVIFLIFLLILWFSGSLCICIAYRVSFIGGLSSSFSSSFFLILFINIKISLIFKSFGLQTPKLKLEAFIHFNNISP